MKRIKQTINKERKNSKGDSDTPTKCFSIKRKNTLLSLFLILMRYKLVPYKEAKRHYIINHRKKPPLKEFSRKKPVLPTLHYFQSWILHYAYRMS